MLAWGGYGRLFLATAVMLVVTSVVTLSVPKPMSSPKATESPDTPTKPAIKGTAALAASVMLFFGSMFAGSLALPLFVTRDLDLPATRVGVLLSVCAVVEIVATLGLAVLPERTNQRWLICGAMLLMGVHFPVLLLAQGMTGLLVAQLGRGIPIAFVGAAGIRYFQDVMAPATARATTLFSNASTAGLLIAGTLGGVSLQVLGPKTTLLLCGVMAVGGAAAFLRGSADAQGDVGAGLAGGGRDQSDPHQDREDPAAHTEPQDALQAREDHHHRQQDLGRTAQPEGHEHEGQAGDHRADGLREALGRPGDQPRRT